MSEKFQKAPDAWLKPDSRNTQFHIDRLPIVGSYVQKLGETIFLSAQSNRRCNPHFVSTVYDYIAYQNTQLLGHIQEIKGRVHHKKLARFLTPEAFEAGLPGFIGRRLGVLEQSRIKKELELASLERMKKDYPRAIPYSNWQNPTEQYRGEYNVLCLRLENVNKDIEDIAKRELQYIHALEVMYEDFRQTPK